VYPHWWKRFILEGELWNATYWKAGFQFLHIWFGFYHPLSVTLFVTLVAVTLWIVYRSGHDRVGVTKQFLKGPPRTVLIGLSAVAVITVISLALMEGRFETPDEMQSRVTVQTDRNLKDSRRGLLRSLYGIEPPKSGLYIYLDSGKLDEAFSSLQQELATILTRTTQSQSESITTSAGVSGIDISRLATQQLQKSIDQAPTEATPARKAKWLIDQYLDLKLSEYLLSADSMTEINVVESYAYREALQTLSERGVSLSRAQEKALKIGDAKARLTKISKTGAPIFYKGKVVIVPALNGFKLSFSAVDGLKCQAFLKEGVVDRTIQGCVHSNRGSCTVNATIMGQILSASLHDRLIDLDIIPIAVW